VPDKEKIQETIGLMQGIYTGIRHVWLAILFFKAGKEP
jgi:hypothetical protein